MADLNALKAGLESVKALVDNEQSGCKDYKNKKQLTPEQRHKALVAELDQVSSVNQVITQVSRTIDKASNDVNTMAVATANANQLLELWVRVLSQTEHNYRLLSNSQWQGASRDQQLMAEKEEEKLRKKEQERLEQERLREQAEVRLQREKQAAERKKAQQGGMHRRIYSRTGTSGASARGPARIGAGPRAGIRQLEMSTRQGHIPPSSSSKRTAMSSTSVSRHRARP